MRQDTTKTWTSRRPIDRASRIVAWRSRGLIRGVLRSMIWMLLAIGACRPGAQIAAGPADAAQGDGHGEACNDSGDDDAPAASPPTTSPVRRGAPIEVIASGRGRIGDLTICDGYLLWSELDAQTIVSLPVGAPIGTEPSVISSSTNADRLSCDDGIGDAARIYWTDRRADAAWSITVTGDDLAFVTHGDHIGSRVISRAGVAYWTARTSVRRQILPFDPPQTLFGMEGVVSALGVLHAGGSDADRLVWTSIGGRQVRAAPILGAGLPTQAPVVVSDDAVTPIALEIGGGVVYWADATTGHVDAWADDALGAVDLAGGHADEPIDLAVSDRSVAWTNACETCSSGGFVLLAPLGHRADPDIVRAQIVEMVTDGEPGLGSLRIGGGYVIWVSSKAGGSISRQRE